VINRCVPKDNVTNLEVHAMCSDGGIGCVIDNDLRACLVFYLNTTMCLNLVVRIEELTLIRKVGIII
jgi:hypothetical protein